jgi:AcrR family transcriptional regulator
MADKVKETETRDQIIAAAREVFVEKGLNGARMQEIADRAGINKALLHYYFTSKQMLFDQIFSEALSHFWPNVASQVTPDMTLKEMLRIAVKAYIQLLCDRPFLPNFILNELYNNPDRLELLIRQAGLSTDYILKWIESEMDKGVIHRMRPAEVVVNILSLCVFPFAARPLAERVWFKNDQQAYDQFISERADTLIPFIERAIFVQS